MALPVDVKVTEGLNIGQLGSGLINNPFVPLLYFAPLRLFFVSHPNLRGIVASEDI